MVSPETQRLAEVLEALVAVLERTLPPPVVPNPPEKLWGADHISYIDDELLWEQEQEQMRLQARGVKETEPSSD